MKPQDILKFWRDVEIFNLPDLDKDISILQPGKPFPWMSPRQLSYKENTWRYILYFGRVEKSAIVKTIEKGLNIKDDEKPDWIEPVTGFTSLAALILDKDGRPDERSYVQASYLHGINCLHTNKPISEVGQRLKVAQEDFELRFDLPAMNNVEEQTIRKGPAISWQLLHQECNYLSELTGYWCTTSIDVYCVVKEVPKNSEPDSSILNSFYLNDLNTLINTNTTQFGKSLQQYLTPDVEINKRRDILKNKDELINSLQPSLIPTGRWPSPTAHGLYTAQAGAVNTTLAELKTDAGIRGINGPPGTGKTTLLLDIIADIITSRAIKLLKTGDSKLFEKEYNKIGTYSGYFNIKDEVFSDSSIVVASNNNAAVENITKELPAMSKIDIEEFKHADYFAACSKRLIKEESWGILSAALGNISNRIAFKLNFWRSGPENNNPGFEEVLSSVYSDENNNQSFFYSQQLTKAKQELNTLLAVFKEFQNKAQTFHIKLTAHINNSRQKDSLEKQVIILKDTIDKLTIVEKEYAAQLAALLNEINQLHNTIRLHNQNKPAFFFFHKIFNTRAFKRWNEPIKTYLVQLHTLNTQKTELTKLQRNTEEDIQRNRKAYNSHKQQLNVVKSAMQEYEELKKQLHIEYEISYSNLVDDVFYNRSIDEMHLYNPYSSKKINRLRSDIFLKSLEVHKYAILAHAKQFRNNLRLFMEMLEGRSIVSEEVTAILWRTFFFCVPVISTTLASVSRLFPSSGAGSLSWLLLDEAGQATPQSAAGIIWRSKRCIIIGDPMQIEPVVTIPAYLVTRLKDQNNVDVTWSPVGASVQILADRISEKGTYMYAVNNATETWTGFPLRTHRRCDNPMFAIANTIAYDNQMVKAMEDSTTLNYLEPSSWFHIAGNEIKEKQVIVEEIILLSDKIKQVRAAGYSGVIFVISPFKSVAEECKKNLYSIPKTYTGTIHTFQGKEADVVFLVLGSNPNSPRSRAWASEKPNILNVALTRAKKRLYVIGNMTLWGSCDYFNVMAAKMNNNPQKV